jgi:hypothetical protein
MVAVLALALCAVSPSAHPSPGALQRAFAAGRVALVDVKGPNQVGYGVLVGSTGEVLTSLRFVGSEATTVRWGETVHTAQVRLRNPELGIAILSLGEGGPYPALAAHLGNIAIHTWLVVLTRSKDGQPRPHLGRVRRGPADPTGRFFHIDVSAAPGSPLLDLQGKLVGLVVADTGSGARALALPALKAELATQTP